MVATTQQGFRFPARIAASAVLTVMLLAAAPEPAPADVTLTNGDGFTVIIFTNRSAGGFSYYYGAYVTTFSTYVDVYNGTGFTPTGLWYGYAFWGSGGLYYGFFTTKSNTTTSTVGAMPRFVTTYPNTTSYFTTNVWANAYDGAYHLWVDVDGNGAVQFTGNGPAATEDNGREVVTGPQNVGGVVVTRKTFVPSTDDFIRHLIILKNTDTVAHTVDLFIDSNIGSDRHNWILKQTNRYAVTGQVWDPSPWWNCCDPNLFHVWDGANARDKVDGTGFANFGDRADWRWNNITVKKGQTKIYAFFVGAKLTPKAARKAARAIADNPRRLTKKMSAAEKRRTRNWNFAPVAAITGELFSGCKSTLVPSPEGGSVAPLSLMALAGLALLRRRRPRG